MRFLYKDNPQRAKGTHRAKGASLLPCHRQKHHIIVFQGVPKGHKKASVFAEAF